MNVPRRHGHARPPRRAETDITITAAHRPRVVWPRTASDASAQKRPAATDIRFDHRLTAARCQVRAKRFRRLARYTRQ